MIGFHKKCWGVFDMKCNRFLKIYFSKPTFLIEICLYITGSKGRFGVWVVKGTIIQAKQ